MVSTKLTVRRRQCAHELRDLRDRGAMSFFASARKLVHPGPGTANDPILRARHSALKALDAALVDYIESLLAGKLDAAHPATDDPLSAAIATLAAKVAA